MAHWQMWLRTLLGELNKRTDAESRAAILESCGRACAPQGYLQELRQVVALESDWDDKLDRLSQGWEPLHRDGDRLSVVYDRCYCPMMEGYPGKLPELCDCSLGWIRELVESVLGVSAEVTLLETVQRGADACRFDLVLGDPVQPAPRAIC